MSVHSSKKHSEAKSASKPFEALIKRRYWILAILAGLLVISCLIDFCLGPSSYTLKDLFSALGGPISRWMHPDPDAHASMAEVIVWNLRLPYAIMAILVGMALGTSGAEMQTLLDNPLASPFTLGVSAAAAFGASLAIVLNLTLPLLAPHWMIPVEAFLCAVGSTLLLELVARMRGHSTSLVILFGIALVFTFQALVSLMQFIANEDQLQELIFWTMGSLTRSDWTKIAILGTGCLLVLPWSWSQASDLTALRLGEERAASYGVDIKRLRLMGFLRISILSSLAVSFVGTIGFVGLVAPHIARRLLGEDHRYYLPGSALCGALIMSMASIAAKNILPGVVIPVGIVTALVGIPFFLATVLQRRD